jgi:hypothetical protein
MKFTGLAPPGRDAGRRCARVIRSGNRVGGMPEPMVRADIEAGRLVRLNLQDWLGGEHARDDIALLAAGFDGPDV